MTMPLFDNPQIGSRLPSHESSKLKFSPVDSAMMQFDRNEMFKILRAEIKSKWAKSNTKLLYGYCAPAYDRETLLIMTSALPEASNYDQRFMQVDYCLVYRQVDTVHLTSPVIHLFCPSSFSSKSLNTMALYMSQGEDKLKEFYDDFFENNVSIPQKIFEGYLTKSRTLIFDKKEQESPYYWKNPNNQVELIKGIQEICEQFRPQRTPPKINNNSSST